MNIQIQSWSNKIASILPDIQSWFCPCSPLVAWHLILGLIAFGHAYGFLSDLVWFGLCQYPQKGISGSIFGKNNENVVPVLSRFEVRDWKANVVPAERILHRLKTLDFPRKAMESASVIHKHSNGRQTGSVREKPSFYDCVLVQRLRSKGVLL